MSRAHIPSILVISVSLALGACAEGPTKQQVGAGVGAIGGALLGSLFGKGIGNVAATAAGGLIGGMAGAAAGKAWDKADQEKADEALDKAHKAPVGQAVAWNNPDTGNAGTVTTTAETVTASGQTCRDYSHTVLVDGKEQTATGTACKQSDGSWAEKQ